jgi:hypothetical protein
VATDDTGNWTPRPDPTLLTTEQLNREIGHLKDLQNLRFELIERQRLESKEDNQKALDAALLAAKDSVSSLAATYQTGNTVLITALDEMKTRLTTIESRDIGKKETSTSLIAWVGLGSSLVYIIATIVLALILHH